MFTTTQVKKINNGSQHSSSTDTLEKILEEKDYGINNTSFCGNGNNCFEFEEFGFNAFSSVGRDKRNVATVPPIGEESRLTEQQPKGYELRLKSTFSRAQTQKELQEEKEVQQLGRTHPNKTSKRTPKSKGSEMAAAILQDLSHDVAPASRALPEGLPFRELSVPTEFERSVSELTMRSHGAVEGRQPAAAKRRMAYYAVGRAAPDGRRADGNRQCYFAGDAVPAGAPFYAGSVRQGPRTLVVFCLPSALGLPRGGDAVGADDRVLLGASPPDRFAGRAEREAYLASLPQPDMALMEEMGRRYPDQFETLPVQVRSSHCWRLFIKFCFFSGLPIAEGEMHYRVKSSVAAFFPTVFLQQQQSEEIALSHEVMEAANGEVSAEILRLPNQNLFDYLRRQYSQQCSKLSAEVFVRSSWEMERPEV